MSAPTLPPGLPPPIPEEPTFTRRLLGAVFLYTCYFGMCFGLAKAGLVVPQLIGNGVAALIAFCFITFGFTTIVVDANATKPLRELAGKFPIIGKGMYEMDVQGNGIDGLFSCPLCSSLWIGSLSSAVGFSAFPIPAGTVYGGLALFGAGLLSAGANWLLHHIISKLGAYS